MSFESVRVRIDQKIVADWPGQYRLIPENFPYDSKDGKPWGRYSVRPINSMSADVAGTFRRRNYFLWVQIFVPENAGTIAANKIGDQLAAIFDLITLTTADGSTLIFQRVALHFVGPDETGWQLWRCEAMFREDYRT